jgi:hypothetical protein
MNCETAESDPPLAQAERTGDGEEPPPLLCFDAACGCALSPRTRITTEIGPQSGTIQAYSYTESHYGKSDTLPISCLRSVILRSEAEPVLSAAEGKNPVPGKQATCRAKNETLRFAQGDIGKCDFCLNALNHAQRPCGISALLRRTIVQPRVLSCLQLPLLRHYCGTGGTGRRNRGQLPGVTQPEKPVTMTLVGGPFLF